MMRVAICYSTKNRRELRAQSLPRLTFNPAYDLHIVDGSDDVWRPAGAPVKYYSFWANVRGGADPAIAFMLSMALNHEANYDYIGLVEQDVLLDKDWYEPTMALFEKGKQDGLEVGAVSARSYADRVLIQRDGYGVMHNLGAGQVVFSRAAARLVLGHFRTGWTLENRRAFAQLSGLDIGAWWAFGGSQHQVCADWTFDRVLAQHGLASVALTPAKCQMIGQEPPLERQGLKLVDAAIEERRNDKAFDIYRTNLRSARNGDWSVPRELFARNDDGGQTIFPHQIAALGGRYEGDWRLKWSQGLGPFSWEAGDAEVNERRVKNPPTLFVPVSGPCAFLVSGGKQDGKIQIVDEGNGYDSTFDLMPEKISGMFQVQVPAAISYRTVRLTALSPGIVFYALTTRELQPYNPNFKFDHSILPTP